MKVIYNPDKSGEVIHLITPIYLEDESILIKDLDDAISKLKSANNQYAPLELSAEESTSIPEVQVIINNDLVIVRSLLHGVTDGIQLIDDDLNINISLSQNRLIPSDDIATLLTTIIIVVDEEYRGQEHHRMYKESLINKNDVCNILIP